MTLLMKYELRYSIEMQHQNCCYLIKVLANAFHLGVLEIGNTTYEASLENQEITICKELANFMLGPTMKILFVKHINKHCLWLASFLFKSVLLLEGNTMLSNLIWDVRIYVYGCLVSVMALSQNHTCQKKEIEMTDRLWSDSFRRNLKFKHKLKFYSGYL